MKRSGSVERTDAARVEGFDAAIERSKLCHGADRIFPEALNTRRTYNQLPGS